MAFALSLDRMSHIPHNCARADEFRLFLELIEPSQRQYDLDRHARILLREEITKGLFGRFHSQIARRFTSPTAPDMPSLTRTLSEPLARRLHQARRSAYRAFSASRSEPDLDRLLAVSYKPDSDWRREWIEYSRDLARFAFFCGLLYRASEPAEYVVTPLLRQYRDSGVSLAELLMRFRLPPLHGRQVTGQDVAEGVRTFLAALYILYKLDSEQRASVPVGLLAAAVACLNTEEEMDEAAEAVGQRSAIALSGGPPFPASMAKAAGRFRLVLNAFLESERLVERAAPDAKRFVRISPSGRWLLEALWSGGPPWTTDGTPSSTGDDRVGLPPGGSAAGAAEGQLKLRQHWVRERNPVLVRKKKEAARESQAELACEACGFVFGATYGPLGEGFIECHHKLPLAALQPGQITRLEDLALVCANCHRMLHIRGQVRTIEELRSLIRAADAADG